MTPTVSSEPGWLPYRRDLANPIWQEVAAFTGPRFRPEWCHGSDKKVLAEFPLYADADTFYRETDVYLYHGPAFFVEGIKRPYYAVLLSMLANLDAAVLDYGCGTGDDGLLLAGLGFNVALADVPSRSLEFARWRALRRGHFLDVYEIGRDAIPVHDIVWCCDVLEHLPPAAQPGLIDTLLSLAPMTFVSLVSDPDADGRVHHPVDAKALTKYAASRRPVWSATFYEGRTRLLVIGEAARLLPVRQP